MSASFILKLDTTAPAGLAVEIDGGAGVSTDLDVLVAITSSDTDLTQVKIYGDVDDAYDTAHYRTLEANAPWINVASPHAVRVTAGDGTKTIYVKSRDDVDNANSSPASDTIVVDTTAPVPNITAGPTPNKISEQATKDSSVFSFSTPEDIQAWKVKVVAAAGDAHSTGTQIPTTAGSTNVSGGAKSSGVSTTVTIKGTDLKTASAGDGDKRVKLFVQDLSGLWSIAS